MGGLTALVAVVSQDDSSSKYWEGKKITGSDFVGVRQDNGSFREKNSLVTSVQSVHGSTEP